MRHPRNKGFTLLELLTVLSIIAILAGLVLSIGGFASRKGARARAEGEIQMLGAACEAYKSDNGSYPWDAPTTGTSVTDTLSPKTHFVPTEAVYTNASLFLYKELSGDKSTTGDNDTSGKGGSGQPNGVPDAGEQRYLKDIEPRILNSRKDPTTKKIIQVNYLQDPFGFAYGYSTAAAKAEADFQKDLKLKKTVKRPSGDQLPGFNIGKFDLWSTGGNTPKSKPSSDSSKELEWSKWIKNW